MEPITLSASRITKALECFGQYYYRYMLKPKVTPVTWPGTIFGLVIHKILEEALNLRKAGQNDARILKLIDGRFEPLFFSELEAQEEKGNQFKLSRDYAEKTFLKKGNDYALRMTKFVLRYFTDFSGFFCEQEVSAPWEFDPEINLIGFIDLVLFTTEKEYRVIDFKTTKDSNKFYFFLWRQDIQSRMYAYLSHRHFKGFPVSHEYLVLNHVDKMIFFNGVQYGDVPKTKPQRRKFFADLITLIADLKVKHREHEDLNKKPNYKYFSPDFEVCKWCDYKKLCPKAIKKRL